MRLIFLNLLILSLFLACHGSKKTSKTNAKLPAEKTQTADTLNYCFIVSFFSIGQGTDYAVQQKFEEYIASFEKEKNIQLAKETAPWGREGEIDFCFKLSELSPEEQLKFISDIKGLLGVSKLVYTKENAPCRNKH